MIEDVNMNVPATVEEMKIVSVMAIAAATQKLADQLAVFEPVPLSFHAEWF